MAEYALNFTTNGTGDGTDTGYTQAQVSAEYVMAHLGDVADEGVAKGYLNELAVTNPSGRTLSTNTGGAWVYGFPYFNTAAVTKTLTHPTTGTTGWRLVLRADYTAQTVRITLVESADGTATIPALTQTENVTWDIPLATGTITTGDVVTVTDARVFAHPNIEVETAMLADEAVTEDKIADEAVTGAKLAATVVDDSTIELAAGVLQVKDGGITSAKLGSDVTGFIKGMIMPFSGTFSGHFPIDPDTSAADTRWHLCNGDTQNGVATPNLADKFVMAAGSTYTAGTTGGAATKDLSHTHDAGTYTANAHTHSVNITSGGPSGFDVAVSSGAGGAATTDHTHTVSGTTSGTQPAVSGTSASGGSATQDVLNPYYALAYICYVGAA